MASYFLWCLITATAGKSHVDSFILSRNNYQLQSSSGYQLDSSRHNSRDAVHLSATMESMSGLSDEILAIVEKRKMPRSELSGLTIRPGYTFGLGCNKWEASSHSGTIDGWNSEPMIRWVSRSLLQELPYESKSIYTELDAELGIESKMKSITDESGVAIQTRLDLQFNIESSYDIPDMRMTVSETQSGYEILLDYIPRVELLSSMDYYDKYFENLEGNLSKLLADRISNGTVIRKSSPTVLSKMLQSPFAVNLFVTLEGREFVKDLCLDYVQRWCQWLDNTTADNISSAAAAAAAATVVTSDDASKSTSNSASNNNGVNDMKPQSDEEKQKSIDEIKTKQDQKQEKLIRMYNRDQSVQKLLFEEKKYELAQVMGSGFAPKAAELAAAIVGPSIGLSSYSLY